MYTCRIEINGPESELSRLIYIVDLLLHTIRLKHSIVKTSKGVAGALFPGKVHISLEELRTLFSVASLKREIETRELDRYGRFDESACDWDTERPVVSQRAFELGRQLQAVGISVDLPKPFLKVILSHDVDLTTHREMYCFLNAILQFFHLKSKKSYSLGQLLQSNLVIKFVKEMIELEEKYNAKSWWYMLSGPNGVGRHSSRTSIQWGSARDCLDLIRKSGMEVGLHGSYFARDKNSYSKEAKRIAKYWGEEIKLHRNHYLRFDPIKHLSQLEQARIEIDSSIGYEKIMGFRAGVGTIYNPYDFSREKKSKVSEIPLVYMDADEHIQDRKGMLSRLERVLNAAKEVCGCVSIVMHPFQHDEIWLVIYEDILRLCQSLNADLNGEIPRL